MDDDDAVPAERRHNSRMTVTRCWLGFMRAIIRNKANDEWVYFESDLALNSNALKGFCLVKL